jgi:hypothetical protein
MTTIDFVLIVYQEDDYPLLRTVCQAMANQTLHPYEQLNLVCVYDPETPQALLDVVREFVGFTIVRGPGSAVGKDMPKHKWAYDRCNADYIAFNHADDISSPNRIETQLRYLEKYPEAALCLSGAWTTDGHPVVFIASRQYGFPQGWPSCWMLNRAVLPTLPTPKVYRLNWDILTILNIQFEHDIIAIQEKHVYYKMGGGTSFQAPANEVKASHKILTDYLGEFGPRLRKLITPMIHYQFLPELPPYVPPAAITQPAIVLGGLRQPEGVTWFQWLPEQGFNLNCKAYRITDHHRDAVQAIEDAVDWEEPFAVLKFLYLVAQNLPILFDHNEIHEAAIHDHPYSLKDRIEGWKAYQEWYRDEIPPNPINLNYDIPHFRLLVIGYLGQEYDPQSLVQKWQQMGIEVVRIAADPPAFMKTHPVLDAELCLKDYQDYDQAHYVKLLPMKPIISRYHPDRVLVCQNDLALDFEGVEYPADYFMSETLWPRWPRDLIAEALFHEFYGAPQKIGNAQTYASRHLIHKELVPYGYNPEIHPPGPPIKDRKQFIGFMGAVGNPGTDTYDCDYDQEHIRDLRVRFVRELEDVPTFVLREKGTTEEYVEFMHDTILALNVPGHVGGINQRQYHAMGMGCVLLQYHYPEIESLGFRGGVNCLLFQNEEELMAKIHWAMGNPAQLQQIADEGRKLAARNTHETRALQMVRWMIRDMR